MLLNHTSGLPDHAFSWAFAWAALKRRFSEGLETAFAPNELVEIVLDDEPLSPAGQQYSYTDTGYILAGLIIEKASGRSYDGELRARLLQPLGLDSSTPADRRCFPHLGTGYLAFFNTFFLPTRITENECLRIHPASEWTGGGLVTTPSDLARWAKLLYEGEALPRPYLDDLLGLRPFGYPTTYGTASGCSSSRQPWASRTAIVATSLGTSRGCATSPSTASRSLSR